MVIDARGLSAIDAHTLLCRLHAAGCDLAANHGPRLASTSGCRRLRAALQAVEGRRYAVPQADAAHQAVLLCAHAAALISALAAFAALLRDGGSLRTTPRFGFTLDRCGHRARTVSTRGLPV